MQFLRNSFLRNCLFFGQVIRIMSVNKNYIVLLIVALCNVGVSFAQVSNLHYIPPFYAPAFRGTFVDGDVGPTCDPSSGRYFHRVVLSTSVEDTFDVTIRTKVDFLGTVSLSGANPVYFDLPTYPYDYDGTNFDLPRTVISNSDLNKILNNQGLILEADKDFFVNISQRARIHGDILTSKGRVGLGKHFFSGHLPNTVIRNSVSYQGCRANFLSVMATEDNTVVTFSNPRILWMGHATNTFSVTLNKEESYVLGAQFLPANYPISYTNPYYVDDFNGTEIVSDKDIVVNTGSWTGSNSFNPWQDMGFDQLVPVTTIGTEFIAVKGEGNLERWPENIIVVSAFDNNRVFLNGSATPARTLNKGEYAIFTQSNYSGQSIYIQTDKSAYVYQSIVGTNEISGGTEYAYATCGLIFIPQLSCEGYKDVTISYADAIGDPQLMLVARKSSAGVNPTVKINGVKIDSALSTTGVAVTGNLDWLTYKITNNQLNTHFNVDGDWTFYVESDYSINAAISFRDAAIGGGGFYSGFGTRPSIQSAPRIFDTNGCAPGNMQLIADDNYYTTYQWYRNGVEIVGADSSRYYPTTRGTYSVKGLTDCGLSRESDKVDVKTCIYWSTKDGDGMDVQIKEDPSTLVPPEDPFVQLEFTLAEPLDFSIYIRYRTIIPSLITYPATPGIGNDFWPIDYNAQIFIPKDSLTGYSDPIWIFDDLKDEEDEQFAVDIIDVLDVDGNIGAVVQDDNVMVTILDDDSIITVVNLASDFGVIENEGYANFKVTISEIPGRSVFAFYRTVANTAIPGLFNDYIGTSGAITFFEGETEKIVSVKINDRLGYNGDRDFFMVLDSVRNGLMGDDTTRCTIVDKEGEDVYLYYVDDTTALEGDSLKFKIRVSQQLIEPVSFRMALTEGTATAADFKNNELSSSTLSASISVLDQNEALAYSLMYSESVGNAVCYLQLSNVLDVPVFVSYYTEVSTALEETDFFPVANQVVFMPGDSIKRIEIPIVNDLRNEENEVFFLHLKNITNAYATQRSWEVSIIDDDPIPTIFIEPEKSVLENEGVARFKVWLSQKSERQIKVNYGTHQHDITPKAIAGNGTSALDDFEFIEVAQLTFNPGDSVKEIAVNIFNNDLVIPPTINYATESPEFFVVELGSVEDVNTASVSPSNFKAIGTIYEEVFLLGVDKRFVYIDNDVTTTEGATMSYTVKRYNDPGLQWRFKLSMTQLKASAADVNYTFTSNFIDAGIADSYSISIDAVDDAILEDDETFNLSIVDQEFYNTTTSAWEPMDTLPGRGNAYGIIVDNDVYETPYMIADTFLVATNLSATFSSLRGVLANDYFYATNPLTSLNWVGGIPPTQGVLGALNIDGSFTYTPATDYTGTFSINYRAQTPMGNVQSTATFIVEEMPTRYTIYPGDTIYTLGVATFDDALVEGDEQFEMTVFDLSSSSVKILTGRNVANGTIIDDDFYPEVHDDYFYVNEDNALFPPTANVLLNDIISANDTITQIVVTTGGAYLQHGYFISPLAINGNFTYMPNPGFNGRDSFLYTVYDTRTDSIYSPAQTRDFATAKVIIDVIPTNDSPIAVDDVFYMDEDDPDSTFYITINDIDPDNVGLTITEIWGNKYGTVQILNNDSIVYGPIWFGNDTLYYRLDDLDSFDDPDTGMVVFVIDGEIDPVFNISSNVSILETNALRPAGGILTFTVTMSSESKKDRYVTYNTIERMGSGESPEDFDLTTGTLFFPKNNASVLTQTVDVPVYGRMGSAYGDDAIDHIFDFVLSNPTYGSALGANSAATGTIRNVVPGALELQIENDVTVVEGDNAVFNVVLSGSPVDIASHPDLFFNAYLEEITAQETLDYNASGYSSGVVSLPSLSIESVNDNGTDFSFDENLAGGIARLKVSLSHALPSNTAAFHYQFYNKGSNQTINEDFISSEQTVVFAPGTSEMYIDIPIINDRYYENLRDTFIIYLSQAKNLTIPTSVSYTDIVIVNDDTTPPTVLFEDDENGGDKSVWEGEGEAILKISLSQKSMLPVSFTVKTQDVSGGGNAVAGQDYTAKTEVITFAAGDSVEYFRVLIANNSGGESNYEDFRILIDGPVINAVTTPAVLSSDITIVDRNTNSSNYIYFEQESTEKTFNEGDDISLVVRSPYSYFAFKTTLSGDVNNSDFNYGFGDFQDIDQYNYIYADANYRKTLSVRSVTDALSEGDEKAVFTLTIPWVYYSGWYNSSFLPGRDVAYATIADVNTDTYSLYNDVYVLFAGEMVSGNILSNDYLNGLNATDVTFDSYSGFNGNVFTSIKIEAESYSSQYGTSSRTCGSLLYRDVDNNDWLQYDNINITQAGMYTMTLRVSGTGNRNFTIQDNGTNVGSVSYSSTSNNCTWIDRAVSFYMSAGVHRIRITSTTNNANLDYFELTSKNIGEFSYTAPATIAAPFSFTLNAAVDLDNGTNNVPETITIYVINPVNSGGFILAAGLASTTLTVPTIDDIIDEADIETYRITLTMDDQSVAQLHATGYTAIGGIIDNDDVPADLILPDIATTWERQPVTFNVLDNDDIANNYHLWLSDVIDPTNGAILDTTHAGDITYQSDLYFTGGDNFGYTATSDQNADYAGSVGVEVKPLDEMENKRSVYLSDNTKNLDYSITTAFTANTFETWVKPVGSGTGILVDLGGNATISRDPSGNIVYGAGFSGTVNVFVNGLDSVHLQNDKWQHVIVQSSTAFTVSKVKVGGGIECYFDEMRIWNKSISTQTNIESIMFEELYHTGNAQLKSMVTNNNVLAPATLGWNNLLFHAKFNTVDYFDVIGWGTVSINGATLSEDLPFNHFLTTAIDNNWDSDANWHFGRDYRIGPDYSPYPEYIILHAASTNNPFINLGSGYSVNSVTSISNLIILQNADFTMSKGALRITGDVFRKPNDRVTFMRGSDGVKVTKSINLNYGY